MKIHTFSLLTVGKICKKFDKGCSFCDVAAVV